MLNWVNLIALVVLTGSLCLEAIYLRQEQRYRLVRHERVFRFLFGAIGVIIMAVTAWWEYDPETRVLGFPFTSAIFELHDGIWYDHVGVVTVPALIANLVFWLFVPQMPITLMALRKTRKKGVPNQRMQRVDR